MAPPDSLTTRSESRSFGGVQGFYEHASAACAGPMRFGLYLPPQAAAAKVPVVYCLAGLTCTEETFAQKAGAQRVASELGLALLTPDTSPRATRFPGDDAHWDFGLGASFYLDATAEPWVHAYRMHTWLTEELPALEAALPIDLGRRAILGHSMGGHGALMLALRHPELYRSCSAFAPISSPSDVPWGEKAFGNYLGSDRSAWAEWDATQLVSAGKRFPGPLLIDQGTKDQFLQRELRPERFEAACAAAGQALALRRQGGYEHGYWFIQTFIEDHLRRHAAALVK